MRDLDALREEIVSLFGDSISSIGFRGDSLLVCLWANESELARRLHRRYGKVIDLQVGFFPFPDMRQSREARRAKSAERDSALPPIPKVVHLSFSENLEIPTGEHRRTKLQVRNESTEDVAANTNGQLLPPIVDPDTGQVVGAFEGALLTPLVRFEIPANAEGQIPVLIGTASTLPERGWAVTQGVWAIRVVLSVGSSDAQRLLPVTVI